MYIPYILGQMEVSKYTVTWSVWVLVLVDAYVLFLVVWMVFNEKGCTKTIKCDYCKGVFLAQIDLLMLKQQIFGNSTTRNTNEEGFIYKVFKSSLLSIPL